MWNDEQDSYDEIVHVLERFECDLQSYMSVQTMLIRLWIFNFIYMYHIIEIVYNLLIYNNKLIINIKIKYLFFLKKYI